MSPFGWPEGKPVPIHLPSNNDYKRVQEPAPTSTRVSNPFNGPPKVTGGKKPIGNSTSRSTLLRSGPSTLSGPPPKRRKIESHAPSAHATGKNKEFPVGIPDDGWDELEITPNFQPSQDLSDVGLKSSSKQFNVVEDGESVEHVASLYSSDPIEQFPPATHDNGGSRVSEIAQRFEVLPKVDFRRRKLLMKGKRDSLRFTPIDNARPEVQPYRIPVKEFYSDKRLWRSAPQQPIWMYTRTRSLVLEVNGEYVNESLDSCTVILGEPLNVEMSSIPTIQLARTNHMKERTTIRLNTEHPDWNKREYIRFTAALQKLVLRTEIMSPAQTDRLWSTAEQNAKVQANQKSQHKSNENGPTDLQSESRKGIFESPLSRQTRSSSALKRKAGDSPDVSATTGSHGTTSDGLRPQRNLRSKNKAFDAEPIPSSLANPEEVVLSYPAGLPGAVNITNADLERLNPGAFLNDTLIEFGLKVWLKDLETSNPELVDQIHVFSSFFYKKFNSKKDSQLAYDSVRKWTNKLDIFQKRYIIVPINEHMHWYLAIICEPERMLEVRPMDVPRLPPRPQTRLSTSQAISSRSPSHEGALEMLIDEIEECSGVEVERDLGNFRSSCTIEDSVSRTQSPQPNDHNDFYQLSPTSPDVSTAPSNHRISPTVSDYETSTYGHHMPATSVAASSKGKQSLNTVDASRFYKPSTQRRYGKKVQSNRGSSERNIDPNERDEVEIIDNVSKTYIFTFDSLGGRHPQAIKKLSTYLKMEAKAKKGVDATGTMEGKIAVVPKQTNHCDCGIYLLHFAQTFMSDPMRYANIILTTRPKTLGDKDRKAIWRVDDNFEPDGRQLLRSRIEALSKHWKKVRDVTQKQSEEVTNEDDESEGEVELVESDTGKLPKSGRKTQHQDQKTGPAARVRG